MKKTGMKNIALRAGGAVLAAVMLTGTGLAATTADASVRPVVSADVGQWARPSIKPPVIYVGQGGSPIAGQLHWTHWTATAWASGKLWIIKPGCYPLSSCPYSSRWTAVSLSRPEPHGSKLYYTRMNWRFYQAGRWVVWHWALRNGFWKRPVG